MNDASISAVALQTLLERPAVEILRILVGLATDKNDAELLIYLTTARIRSNFRVSIKAEK